MVSSSNSNNKGLATLPTVMVIGMLVLAIVASLSSLAFNESLMSQGIAQSSNALFYAEAGARDALMKIARDKNYQCVSVDCYSLDFVTSGCSLGTGCAKISVSAATGTTADPKVITSKGIVGNSIRTVQVSVTLDNGTTTASAQNGQIATTTWTEITN